MDRVRIIVERLVDALDAVQRRHVWLSFPLAVFRKMSNDQGGSLAALIAYYGFLSTFPLLLVFASILGFVLAGDPSLKAQALRTTENSFPALAGYINKTLSGSSVALGLGLAGALTAGLGVTRATERAMNNIWDVPMAERPNLWRSRLRGLAMLGLLGTTLLASSALAGLRSAGGPLDPLTEALGIVGPLVLNLLLYLLAFQVLTQRHLTWHRLLPGAFVGSAGWTALQSLGAFYVRHEIAHASQLYGSLAVVVGLMAWIYLGAQLTLYAAEINVVLTLRLWPRSLRGVASTDADRRALARQAREAERSAGEVITVSFEQIGPSPATDPLKVGEEAGPSSSSLARTRPESPVVAVPSVAAATTHAEVASAIAHLQVLDRTWQQLERCGEGEERQALLERLRGEAAAAAAALHRLGEQEAELAATLRQHLE